MHCSNSSTPRLSRYQINARIAAMLKGLLGLGLTGHASADEAVMAVASRADMLRIKSIVLGIKVVGLLANTSSAVKIVGSFLINWVWS